MYCGVFSFSRLTPPRAEPRFRWRPSRYQAMVAGGTEYRAMVQLRLMLLPGFTKTAFSPWITAAAAEK